MKRLIPIIALLMLGLALSMMPVFIAALKPSSTYAFWLFTSWLALPYLLALITLIHCWSQRDLRIHYYCVVCMVSVAGILFVADIIFWHPDPQGALAILMVPILQALITAMLLPVVGWLFRKLNSR